MYTNEELAKLAVWAEQNEREAKTDLHRRGASAIRQGCDWLLRARLMEAAEAPGVNVRLPKEKTQ